MDDCNAINTIANAVIAVSALLGAFVAGLGLKTWRNELHGRTEYDLAKRILTNVYLVRNEIQQIRNIFSLDFVDTQYERLNRKASDVDAVLLEAEVLWGGDKLQPAKNELKECLITLRESMRRRLESQREGLQLSTKQQDEMHSILDGDSNCKSSTFHRAIASLSFLAARRVVLFFSKPSST